MSKAAAGPLETSAAGLDLPFEEALKKLEAIVESMEGDDLPLESLLSQFEEGSRLAQACPGLLTNTISSLENSVYRMEVLREWPSTMPRSISLFSNACSIWLRWYSQKPKLLICYAMVMIPTPPISRSKKR